MMNKKSSRMRYDKKYIKDPRKAFPRIWEKVFLALKDEETGHDLYHACRIYKMAMRIIRVEGGDIEIVGPAVLLHDIFWPLEMEGNIISHYGETQLQKISKFLDNIGIEEGKNYEIINCIRGHDDLKTEHKIAHKLSLEAKVLRDADRLDAVGAIGIARCFQFGGAVRRSIWNPDIEPLELLLKLNFSDKKSINRSSIAHFYEKLLKIKKYLYFEVSQKIANKRLAFLKNYLRHFYKEWEGK